MKLHKSLLVFGVTALLLTACGEAENTEETDATNEVQTEEVDGTETQSSDTQDTEEESTDTEGPAEASSEEENLREYNEVVADNDNFTATLVSIEYIYDDMWDEEKIEVTFDVENKREEAIEVQARSVSINDRMVDESLLSMSQEVGPGKSASAVLDIQDYEGAELPALEGNFEMTLHVFSWDNMDYTEDVVVTVPLD